MFAQTLTEKLSLESDIIKSGSLVNVIFLNWDFFQSELKFR